MLLLSCAFVAEFTSIIKQLEKELQNPLPGEEAQFAMAPYLRRIRKEAQSQNPSPKLSAVLVLLYPVNNEPYIILILRNSYEGVHSAQVSFPGGRKDESDMSLEETALREAQEETGIDKTRVRIIGKLSQVYIPPSGFLVQPFIGVAEEKPNFIPDKKEVHILIETPLKIISDNATVKTKNIKLSNGLIMHNTPYFDIYGHTVWGATAMMLGELKIILERIAAETE